MGIRQDKMGFEKVLIDKIKVCGNKINGRDEKFNRKRTKK